MTEGTDRVNPDWANDPDDSHLALLVDAFRSSERQTTPPSTMWYRITIAILTAILIAQTLHYYGSTLSSSPAAEADFADAVPLATNSSTNATAYVNPYLRLPSLAIFCRTFAGGWDEIKIFEQSLRLFWPTEYIHSGLTYVLDDESPLDHKVGTLLAHMHRDRQHIRNSSFFVEVHYERLPGEHILTPRSGTK